jgi:K(+)-stimulated pyrophosphate-energized sodium pump
MMVMLFSAMTMKAVSRAAGAMVAEVRRQFRAFQGILDGTQIPDYARCVEISTIGAQREMILPAVIALLFPVLVGLIIGPAGVMGLLVGALGTGFVTAVFLNNSGGAWDNAKKFIEKGGYKTDAWIPNEHLQKLKDTDGVEEKDGEITVKDGGEKHSGVMKIEYLAPEDAENYKKLTYIPGKNSDAHKATVTGDTVGDPYKDTSGPSLNILLKLMTMSSIVFGFLTAYIWLSQRI